MGEVVNFKGQTFPIFYASREVVEWKGKTCERWVTIVRHADGREEWQGPYKTKADAIGITALIANAEAQRRAESKARANHPLVKFVEYLSSNERRALAILLADSQGPA